MPQTKLEKMVSQADPDPFKQKIDAEVGAFMRGDLMPAHGNDVPAPWNAPARCGDCGAKKGEFHHPGCDMERCPVCRNQAINCRHYYAGWFDPQN